MFLGRSAERIRLEQLLAQARASRSGSLLLSGAPGAGKSELLNYAASIAGSVPVLRAAGVQAERELPFSLLHQLLRPALHLLAGLPQPQRHALEGALALGPATGGDRFIVSAAVLTLLADHAEPGGVLCLLDDAQWADRASLDALLFAARRLEAEGVILIFAARDGETDLEMAGIPALPIGGLDSVSAAALITDCAGIPTSDAVVAALLVATGGNPLALTELAALLGRDKLSGAEPLPDPLPMSAGIERAFLARILELPAETQQLLLVAAAEGTGDLGTVLMAAASLQVPGQSLDAAEAAGLVTVSEGLLSFRHPLVRSALYAHASSVSRREVHTALSDTLTGSGDVDRRTWHRAAATVGLDDAVADALAAAAHRARLRSGHAGAAAALRRSAQLTTDHGVRARRLLASAEDAWLAGKPEAMDACLTEARHLTSDPDVVTDVVRLRARWELRRGTATEAYTLFVDAAMEACGRDPDTALEMLAEASEAAANIGDVGGMIRAGRLAERVRAPVGTEARFWADFSIGVADVLDGRRDRAEPRLQRVIRAAVPGSKPRELVFAGVGAVWLGQWATAIELYERAAVAARIADMTGNLPYVLEYLAVGERTRGRYATSAAVSEEGLRLGRETGQETSVCNHLANLAHLAALSGDEAACRTYADDALRRALPRRLGLPAARASLALAVLDVGLGRYGEALQAMNALAAAGPGVGHPAIVNFSLPDRVEAAVRCGELASAHDALVVLDRVSGHADSAARAVLHRCRAQLASDEDAAVLFAEAMRLHAEGRSASPEIARTQLVYGEWLRRARRPAESRRHLRSAMEVFDRLGAVPWAERARVELKASGETMREGGQAPASRLTPQEVRIAQAVAAGKSTKEIAARLFLSPRTVEYHLHKMFPKLGITSRIDLVRLVAAEPDLIEG